MKRLLTIIFGALLIAHTVLGQKDRKVFINLNEDGKEIKLPDDFKIYIAFEDTLRTTVIKPVIKNSAFIMPDFGKPKRGFLIFRYKQHLPYFIMNMYTTDRKTFSFSIERKPSNKKYQNNGKKKVVYMYYLKVYYDGENGEKFVSKLTSNDPEKYRADLLKMIE